MRCRELPLSIVHAHDCCVVVYVFGWPVAQDYKRLKSLSNFNREIKDYSCTCIAAERREKIMGLKIIAGELPFSDKGFTLFKRKINHQIKDYRREAAGINGRLKIMGRPIILRPGPSPTDSGSPTDSSGSGSG